MIIKLFKARLRGDGRVSALERAVSAADRSRDSGDFSAAAEAYARAVAMSPGRTDLRVQLGNMLKDSGNLATAESAYRLALDQDPHNADIYLQLGHVHKLRGERSRAIGSYRRALELNPLLAGAHLELASAGEATEQISAFELHMRQGGVEALLTIRARLDEIAAQIGEIRRGLPDVDSSVAFPVEAYAELRRIFDCPPPRLAAPELFVGIVLLADRAPLKDVQLQIAAIIDQAHGRWALKVLGSDPDRRELVHRVAARDERIGWVDHASHDALATAEMTAAAELGADWVLLLSPGARLHPLALSWIAAVARRAAPDAIVMDEEVCEANSDLSDPRPIFRQTVDPDTILEANIYGETVAVESGALRGLVRGLAPETVREARGALLLNLIRGGRVAHIPLPLVRTVGGEIGAADEAASDHAAAVRSYVGEDAGVLVSAGALSVGVLRIVRGLSTPPARIAVIIPTKNNADDVTAFIRSLVSLAARPDQLEILVLNNGRPASLGCLPDAIGAAGRGLAVLDIAEPFNWSRFNNLGASKTSAPLLVFANDDMLMLSQGWDDILRSILQREEVGAVGARLLYGDNTVQHAGILFNWRGSAIHDGLYRPATEAGPVLRWHVTRAVSAVTGAFLATRRSDFNSVGGFDEAHLAVSYNDVDFALKQRARGLRILWTPLVTLFHYESKTRGLDHLAPTKRVRDAAERRILEDRWPEILHCEPSLNPFWRQATLPHRLIGFPSQDEIWAHIDRSATPNPWAVSAPRS